MEIVPKMYDALSTPKGAMMANRQAYNDHDDVSDPLHVVIGASRSSASIPTAMVSGIDDIPQISYWATSSDLDNNYLYPYFMRTIPIDEASGKAAAEILGSWGMKSIGVLYVNDAYGTSYMEGFVAECAGLDIVTHTSGFVDANSDSITAAVELLAEDDGKDLQAVFFICFDGDFVEIVAGPREGGHQLCSWPLRGSSTVPVLRGG